MKKAYICVLITALLFGSMEVACKVGGSDLDEFQLTFLRFVIGGLLLLPFGIREIRRRRIRLGAGDLLELAGVGTIGVAISMVLFQLGVMSSNASTAAVIFCVNPFFTMIFAHFFSDERLDRSKAVVLAFALAGIFFMLRPWDVQTGNSFYGMSLMILAALTFGIYTVAAKRSVRKMGTMAQTSISFLFGAGVLLILILIMDRPVMAGVGENLPIILYVGVMVTGLGYFFYFKAIEMTDAATGSFAFFLKPAIAPVLALIILRETILWNTVVGIGLILAASLLNILQQKQAIHIGRVQAHRRGETGEK